ncbi:unnamed protein product [Rotaria magnacalcarata]
MISQPVEEISTTPRIKRRQYSTEKNSNADTTNVENQPTLARERMFTNRALTLERNSATRTSLTPEEAAQQRILASMRTMATQATASPKIAEEQRVLTRKRIAARRSLLKTTSKSKQIVTKTGVCRIIEVEWPKSVDMKCKTSCLKKFIQQMSMSSLAEGVCGICNIRCYLRDLRCVPLNKIPSIELLKTSEDLCSVVSCIQRTQNLHSDEKYNINNDVDLAMAEGEAG